ncbi:MAG: hypothetical protein DRJ66_02680 [Thermoprotei archaeon]|nr:MAG: hypothetical protein DRJ66_02680 [Thermoprotei archaeon]RLF20340.1 MAG: hypothetical protein DRZ82_02720 [Thermoprotei archaeon]
MTRIICVEEPRYFYAELNDITLEPSAYDKYLSFIEQTMVKRAREFYEYVARTRHMGNPALVLRVREPGKGPLAEIILQASKHPKVWIIPLMDKLKEEEVEFMIRRIELASLYYLASREEAYVGFVFLEKMKLAPEKTATFRQKITEKLFHGTMFYLFAISLILAYFLYVLLGSYIFVAMPLSQLYLLLFVDKIMELMADWRINKDNRYVYIVTYTMPIQEYKYFLRRYYPLRFKIKSEIYANTLALGKEITLDVVEKVFKKYNLVIDELHKIGIKKIDVYGITRKVFRKYGLLMPKIVILNTSIPNAAATGIGSDIATLVITSGLLLLLSDEELEAVLAHEASHIKNRDPLMMFMLSTGEYILRIFVFVTFIYLGIANFFTSLLYLFVALLALFFIAKFFEARADLEAALITGKPEALSRALKKMGIRRLLTEDYPRTTLESWLNWDPHPPVSWRIIRLEQLKGKFPTEHPLVYSAKECISGLLHALR